ncbi:integrase, catalytic region, zinc finger, CCHC-type containing protein [Tanacetum coccineum]|uniref:Integrase, catalytic region, zinc finger, CCHC-type containing protein n=1 Tax=Tanacetum coccineum TaxID=301880 RepID=A0ABQ5AE47_9ASTR
MDKSVVSGSFTTWTLRTAFLKQIPPAFPISRQTKAIRNFGQECNEPLHLAWERFNDLLYNCLEHKINKHEQLQIFYQGLDLRTRKKAYFKGPIPRMTPGARIKAIDELHLDAKKKFVMYPRVISVFLANQLKNVSMPLDCFPINALTSKVLSFMVKKGKNFLGNVTPLFDSMLVQLTEDEGEASERPSESQPIPSPPHPSEDQPESQTDLSPRPYAFIPILDSIPEGSGGNHGGQSSSNRSLSGNEDGLTL